MALFYNCHPSFVTQLRQLNTTTTAVERCNYGSCAHKKEDMSLTHPPPYNNLYTRLALAGYIFLVLLDSCDVLLSNGYVVLQVKVVEHGTEWH